MSFMDERRRAHLGSRDFVLKTEDARRNAQFHLHLVVGATFRDVSVENKNDCRRPL